MWGFCHSTLVTVPVNVTGLLASNSAAKEWCASTGTAARSRPKAATKTEIFLISSLHAKFTLSSGDLLSSFLPMGVNNPIPLQRPNLLANLDVRSACLRFAQAREGGPHD